MALAKRVKKCVNRAEAALLALLLLGGCAQVGEHESRETSKPKISAGAREHEEPASGEDARQEYHYYYDCLSDGQRHVYDAVLQSLAEYDSDTVISCESEDDLQKAFRSVMADHPELFYVTGYKYAKKKDTAGEDSFVFSGTYSMPKESLDADRAVIEEYVRRCFADMPDGDDYAKIRYLYEYLIRNTGYSPNAPDNQNMWSVFYYGQSVCQGYAKAFQYLCGKAGIWATIVTGKIIKTGYGHSWNLVWADGESYYVDVTWGDIGYSDETGEPMRENEHVNYDYLCVSERQIRRTHEIDGDPKMPPCTAKADNYYVREHTLFTEFDETLLEEAFARAQDGYVTFACDGEAVFRRYEEYLIGQERVFDYMSSPQGIAYCVSEDMLSFGFWLPRN